MARQTGILLAYYSTLTLFLIAAFIPELRVWGFNWWGYYPVWVPVGLFIAGAVVPFVGDRSDDSGQSTNSRSTFWIVGGGCIAVLAVCFSTLYNRTHFLGDGYMTISLAATAQPLVKYREIGESLVHIWVRNLLGGTTEAAVEMSYRVVSIAAGIGIAITTLVVSSQVFSNFKSRILFFLGMMSGGYALLFFGYVENYSLLVLSVTVYTYVGLLAVRGSISRWWILVGQTAAVFFHIFGVVLVPATLYLIVRDTSLSRRWSRISPTFRFILAVVVIAILFGIFFYARSQSLFLRIAVLPIVPHLFTIEGYTLFSLRHIIDYANLLVLLVPGLLVAIFTIDRRLLRDQWSRPASRFLLATIVCSLGAVFIFDPKLGMPRDWDLFAFAGIPLAALVFIALLDRPRPHYRAAILATALGLLLLGPRVVSQIMSDTSLAHAYAYKDLDRVKNRNLYGLILRYLNDRGETITADSLRTEWNQRFPERLRSMEVPRLIDAGQYRQAAALASQLLKSNPLIYDAWANLGLANENLGNIDSAIFCYEIANGLNPGHPVLLGNFASSLILKGELDRAESLIREALQRDSTIAQLYYHKARIARARGDRSMYFKHLTNAALRAKGPHIYRAELLNACIQAGDFSGARRIVDSCLALGLDSAYVDTLVARYPQLNRRSRD